ncbi:MAG TPA: alpha/beta fold hydrolase [Thermoanaerobaculia bacterium]|nr:alpha/beta fold hydrolase [Thermoanaerobaculia bacterium]
MGLGFVLLALPRAEAQASGRMSHVAEPEEVRFHSGDLALGGLFFVPHCDGPFPAAVFIRGSGPSSRNSYWARSLVDVLVERGIAVLLPDKRGSDASEGDWRTADFEDLAEDALAGVNFVRSRPGVIRDRVGLVGLSQGGKIAPIAASASDAVAFVVNLVGAASPLKEQVSWEMYHTFREAGVEGAALQQALGLQVLAEGYLEGLVNWQTYHAARLAASSGPGSGVAKGFPATPDAWQWAFFRSVLDFDPIPYWRKVTQPLLVMYGEDDHNAPTVDSAYRLIRVWRQMDHPDATLRIIPGTGHGLWEPKADPHRPVLHPSVVTILGEWLTTRLLR